MGGGVTATIRATSKVAGFAGGFLNSSLRGSAAPAAAEQAVRKSSIPVSAMLSSSSSSRGVADVASIQQPAWEIEELELAGGVEDNLVGEAMPRVVFAEVASFDEAKEATLELKDALDKVYLSSDRSPVSDVENISNGTITVSNNAIKAFKFFSSSPEAQDVVASIACDENVWNAVRNNSALQDFLQSNKNNVEFHEPFIPDDSSAKWSWSWFKGKFERAKSSTVNLVNRFSTNLQEMFDQAQKMVDHAQQKDRSLEIGSIMVLAMMVIMVILTKRK